MILGRKRVVDPYEYHSYRAVSFAHALYVSVYVCVCVCERERETEKREENVECSSNPTMPSAQHEPKRLWRKENRIRRSTALADLGFGIGRLADLEHLTSRDRVLCRLAIVECLAGDDTIDLYSVGGEGCQQGKGRRWMTIDDHR